MHNREPGGLPQPGKPGAGGGNKVPGVSKVTLLSEVERVLKTCDDDDNTIVMTKIELEKIAAHLRELDLLREKYRLLLSTRE